MWNILLASSLHSDNDHHISSSQRSSPSPAPSSSSLMDDSSFFPSSLSVLFSSWLSLLFDAIRHHTISLFFLFLMGSMFLWIIGFNFIFRKSFIIGIFRWIGVGTIRTKKAFLELKRKSFHLAGLLIPSIYYVGLKYFRGLMTPSRASLLLGALTTFLWIIELLRLLSPAFRSLYNIVFGSMLRKSETNDDKAFTGTGFFFLGNFLCVALFDPTIAICSSLFLVLGDMSAAIIGISFGRIKIGKKSLEGSLGMFFSCFIIGCVMFWHVPLAEYVIFAGALTATLTELLAPSCIDDNLSIPLSSAIALHLAFSRIGIRPPPV